MVNKDKIKRFDVSTNPKDNPEGYMLNVALEHPEELNDFHNDYPLAPEKIEIKESMLSDFCGKIGNKDNRSVGGVKNLYRDWVIKRNVFFIIETCNYIYS